MTVLNKDRVMRKFRLVLDLVDAGRITPDGLELLAVAAIAKDAGELELARRAERIARRLYPNLQKDLS